MPEEEVDVRRRKRSTLLLACVLLLLFGLAFSLPFLAVFSGRGINLGAAIISAEVYDEPTRTWPLVLHRQLEGPVEITHMLDSAAPPLLPWSAGREVQISCFGWTYRALIIYPGAHRRESNRLLDKWRIRYRA